MAGSKYLLRVGLNYSVKGKIKTGQSFESLAKNWQTKEISLDDLAGHICKGYAWMPGQLKPGTRRKNENVDRAEVLAIDIDHGMTIAEALQHPIVSEWAALGVTSASHSEAEHKFRLVFRLPAAIEGEEAIKAANRLLIGAIGTADKACKDAARFFFGATNAEVFLRQEVCLPEDWQEQFSFLVAAEEEEEAGAEEEKGDRAAIAPVLPQLGTSSLVDFLDKDIYPRLSPEQLYNWTGHKWATKTDSKMRGCCPFHDSQSGTAFYIDYKGGKWLWNCPSCDIGGSPVEYRYALRGGKGSPKGEEFVEICKELAQEAGVAMPEMPRELRVGTVGDSAGVAGSAGAAPVRERKPESPEVISLRRTLDGLEGEALAKKFFDIAAGWTSLIAGGKMDQVLLASHIRALITLALEKLDEMTQGLLWKSIAAVAGVNKTTVAKWAQGVQIELTSGTRAGKISEAWLAAEAVKRWAGTIVYDTKQGDWFKYEAHQRGVWGVLRDDQILSEVKDLAKELLGDTFKSGFIKGATELFRIDSEILRDSFQPKASLLVFRNLVLDTSTGMTLPHSSEWQAKWGIDRDYDPSQSDWSLIAEFITKAIAIPVMRDRLICFHAAILRDLFDKTGGKKALLQVGDSGTGKGTALNLVSWIIGSHNVMPVDSMIELETNQFSLEGIEEKQPRIITLPDTEPLSGKNKIDRFLSLTGNDIFSFSRKHKRGGQIKYTGGMVINSTAFPFARSHRKRGSNRRCVLITGWRKDSTLRLICDQIEHDHNAQSAYINFLLSIPESEILETLQSAPGEPSIGEDAKNDPLTAWFMDCIEITGNSSDRIQLGRDSSQGDKLFGSYFKYCEDGNLGDRFIRSHTSFANDFEDFYNRMVATVEDPDMKFGVVKPKNKLHYTGIRFKVEIDDSSRIASRLDTDLSHVRREVSHKSYIQQVIVRLLDQQDASIQQEKNKTESGDEEKNSYIGEIDHASEPINLTHSCNTRDSDLSPDLTGLDRASNPSSQSTPTPSDSSPESQIQHLISVEIPDCQTWAQFEDLGIRYPQEVKQAAWDALKNTKEGRMLRKRITALKKHAAKSQGS